MAVMAVCVAHCERTSLGDPGVDDNDTEMLHEELLGADPSGREGREESTT
jgi:hypothetical protein